MRYIQSLVTRTRQTDKIPMSLMLDAINYTLASSYGIEFESVLPTYLCDCNYKNFKTSSFHKRFNPCPNCLIIDLEKTVSRTFRYANKSDVREKDPITETETVFMFFPDEEPKVDINSKDKLQRGFVGEDLEGRTLPKELIAEFKKDDDWDDFYSDDDSFWESYDYDNGSDGEFNADYDFGEGWDYQSQSESEDNEEFNVDSKTQVNDNPTGEPINEHTSATEDCDFQILQQIKSKKYILDVDQRINITNVATIDLDTVTTKGECGDDHKWKEVLHSFIRCGWCRINILRNSGDGDKELAMIANQLRLMSEAYQKIFSLEEKSAQNVDELSESENLDSDYATMELDNELMPVLKKMVTLGKDKEAMLIAKNWLPILKELFPWYENSEQDTQAQGEEELDSTNGKEANERGSLLIADVLVVLGVLEFRRRQDGWAAQHLLESIKLASQYAQANEESFDIYNYLSAPSQKPSPTPWLLKEEEALRLSELLSERASENLNRKQQWFLYESLLSYLKQKQTDMEPMEQKKSVALMTKLSKKMLKESRTLINEDKEYYVPKVAQLQYDLASYYYSKEKWEDLEEYIYQARDLLNSYPDLLPLDLKADILALLIKLRIHNYHKPFDEIKELIDTTQALYNQNQNIESLEKEVEALLEGIKLNISYIEELRDKKYKAENEYESEDWEEEGDELWEPDYQLDDENWEGRDNDKEGNWKLPFDVFDEDDDADDMYDDDEELDSESKDDVDYQAKIDQIKEGIDKDFSDIQSLMVDFKNTCLVADGPEDPESQVLERKLQLLEIRIDCVRVKYLLLEEDDRSDEKIYQIYQSLIERISQLLEQEYDKELYQLYKEMVRNNAMLCFHLEKFNEAKKGYKQLISYQKNLIANIPQKGRAFQEANLELARTNCYLGAYYWDLKTYDHALKYAQIAQKLVDEYADLSNENDVDFKLEVYSFLHLVAQDMGREDIDNIAKKEGDKLEKILRTKFHKY